MGQTQDLLSFKIPFIVITGLLFLLKKAFKIVNDVLNFLENIFYIFQRLKIKSVLFF